MSIAILEALGVTAELTGTDITTAALRVMEQDLDAYPEEAVLQALSRCRKELSGRLTLAAIIQRVQELDGRPGPEEAWGMIPKDESGSVIWTDEMAQAFGNCYQLLDDGDHIAARMAFVESYRTLVRQAREFKNPVKWTPSFGHDPSLREGAILKAVELGRLPVQRACALLPSLTEKFQQRGLLAAPDVQPNPQVISYLDDFVKTVCSPEAVHD